MNGLQRCNPFLFDRLREVRNGLGLAIPDLAARLNVAPNTLGSYEREKRSLPDPEFLARFAKVTGADLGVLLEARLAASEHSADFKAAMRRIRDSSSAVARFAFKRSLITSSDAADLQHAAFARGLGADDLEREFGARYPINKALQDRADYVYIPLYEGGVRGALGRSVPDGAARADALALNEEWIEQTLHMPPANLRLMYVETDSHEPELRPGDIMLVDYTDQSARREGIYVIDMDGALLIKRLQRLPGGVVKVTSRNEAYEPFTVPVADIDTRRHFSIVGRLVIGRRRF